MKRLTLILALAILTISAFSQKSNYKVFPFKSGIVEYKSEGKTKGTTTKYIEDYGYKQADYTKTVTKMFGVKSEENTGTILIGAMIYAIDYNENTIGKGKNPVYETYANSAGKDYEELGTQAMESLGFTKTGNTGEILGKECEIWKGALGEIWTWKNLALKTKTKILGMKIEETATKITIDTKVPNDKFEIPTDMKVEELQTPEGMGDLQNIFGGNK